MVLPDRLQEMAAPGLAEKARTAAFSSGGGRDAQHVRAWASLVRRLYLNDVPGA